MYVDDLKLSAKNRNKIESAQNSDSTMQRGKILESEGIEFKNGDLTRNLNTELHVEMKAKTCTEYKVVIPKLCSGNINKTINTRAVSVLRYTALIVDST